MANFQETIEFIIEGEVFRLRVWFDEGKKVNVSFPQKNELLNNMYKQLIEPLLKIYETKLKGQKSIKDYMVRRVPEGELNEHARTDEKEG